MATQSQANRLLLPVSELNEGVHEYEFTLGNAFFQQFENTLIEAGDAVVKVTLTKHAHLMEVDLSYTSGISIQCDRCLKEVKVPFEGDDYALVRPAESAEESSDEDVNEILMPATDNELDISQFVYESLCLEIPMVRVPCELTGDDSVCDRDMLQKLDELRTQKSGEEPDEPEPGIWDKLKGFTPDEN